MRGYDGEEPELEQLWELGCLGLWLQAGDEPAVVAYFPGEIELPLPGVWEAPSEIDHVAEYQAGLAPVRVGQLVVAPSHSEVVAHDGDQILWLDPGSAFGTGHHETTSLALAALTKLDLRGRSVLDVGSGSGLLAIAADRLGAQRALGVDVDAHTIGVARHNAQRNRSRARFARGSLEVTQLPGRFDVIVANLYAELHAQLLPSFAERLLPGGRLLITGILTSLRQMVVDAIPASLSLDSERQEGEWLLFELTRSPRTPLAQAHPEPNAAAVDG